MTGFRIVHILTLVSATNVKEFSYIFTIAFVIMNSDEKPCKHQDTKNCHLITVSIVESITVVLFELRSWEYSLYKYQDLIQTLWNIFQTSTPSPNTFPSQQIVPIIAPSS